MAKPSEFKITPPQPIATGPKPSETTEKPRGDRPPGTKTVTFYTSRDGWLQLRTLAGREDTTAQALMLEALDLLFETRGLIRCATPSKVVAP
jgi:hypothetical protein